jgi:DNA-binding GntR family transcriptional regulator
MPLAARRAAGKTARGSLARPEAADGSRRLDHVSRAYQELRRIIVLGQLPPGSRISERIVADRLKLSRTPVRSALHRLEQEGFVTAHGAGRERRLIVAPLTRHDGREVFTIVGHLEGLAARTAAELPTPERKALVVRLREVNDALATEARKKGDATRFFELDIEFHRLYVEEVVGPRLLALHRAIKPQSERYIRLYVSVLLDQIATSVREHERIAASISRGDPDAAQVAVETNWRNAAERLTHIIAQFGERGSLHSWEPDTPEPTPARGGRAKSRGRG